MTSTTANTAALLKSAKQNGALSGAALQAIDVNDVGAEINAALGVSVDDVPVSEVILVTQLLDDSSSIRFVTGNTEAVRDGHNLVIDALAATKQREGILAMCRYLNRGLQYAYAPVANAVRLNSRNYDPSGGTPLFDETVTTLATVLAKSQEFLDNGIACRSVTAIITDGGDSGSKKRAGDVKKIVGDMLRQENHIVALIGVSDGSTDFRQVAKDMGIPDAWVLTPSNSPSEIRKAFAMLSQSAVRASQGAGTFSQAAMGGFGG